MHMRSRSDEGILDRELCAESSSIYRYMYITLDFFDGKHFSFCSFRDVYFLLLVGIITVVLRS